MDKNLIETKIGLDDVDDFILASALKFYKPENYVFISYLLANFNKMYAKVGTTEDLLEKENYIFYLQNVYTRSFEMFEYYNDVLKSGDVVKVPEKLEEAVILIKDLVNTYLSCDKENNIKVNTIKRLANNVSLNLTNTYSAAVLLLTRNFHWKKHFHSGKLLKNSLSLMRRKLSLESKLSRLINVSSELVNSLLDKIKEYLNLKDSDILRNILVLLSQNLDGGSDIAEKLIKLVENDLENKELCDKFIEKDLEIINNLVTNPIISKILLNSPTILPNLNRIFEEKANNLNIRGLIAKILSNLTANPTNNDTLIQTHPDLIKKLNKNLKENKLNLSDSKERAIATSEVDTFINLLTDFSKSLSDKGIIVDNDIDAIVKNFEKDEEFGEKLNKIRSLLNAINKEKQALENLTKDVSFMI